jgi:hypothetical protein
MNQLAQSRAQIQDLGSDWPIGFGARRMNF